MAACSSKLRLFRPDSRTARPVKTVLFATDLSASSRDGLNWATWLTERSRGRLLIVYVDEPLKQGEGQLYEGVPRDRGTLLARLTALVPTDSAVRYAHRMLVGDPAIEIVRLARSEAATLIILGTRRRTGVRRLLKASVAEAVVRRATCPVLVIPQT
jgi:universal stress protein A